MKAAHPAMRDDAGAAARSPFHAARLGSVLLQGEMAAISGMVRDVFLKKAPEMALVQDHDPIQKLR